MCEVCRSCRMASCESVYQCCHGDPKPVSRGTPDVWTELVSSSQNNVLFGLTWRTGPYAAVDKPWSEYGQMGQLPIQPLESHLHACTLWVAILIIQNM